LNLFYAFCRYSRLRAEKVNLWAPRETVGAILDGCI
jgi:hypothetical protein